jgi:uncharacterized circularly permuted ATP-grasp superfamily protein/uncharacterized alpha-E superfamily protein
MTPGEINVLVARSRASLLELGQAHSSFEAGVDLDPLPLRLSADEGRILARGAAQWGEFLSTVYSSVWRGSGELLPDRVLWEDARLDPSFFSLLPAEAEPLSLVGLDLERLIDGSWAVRSVTTGVPRGLGFSLENRIVHKRVLGNRLPRTQIDRLAPFFQTLKDRWSALAPHHREEPAVMVWTAGPSDRHYFEHVYLARYFGYPLVESRDLTVRGGRVFLKLLGSLQTVDVLIRMVGDSHLDPLSGSGSLEGVATLLNAVRDGAVYVTNAPGSDFLEHPAIFPHFGRAVQTLGWSLDLPPSPGTPTGTELFWNGAEWERLPLTFRIFTARTAQGWDLLPGGLAQTPGGAFKDVWVSAEKAVPYVSLLPQNERPSEIHRTADLPSRVADDLHWLGRYAERAWVDLRFLEKWWDLVEADHGEEGADSGPLEAVADRMELRTPEVEVRGLDDWRLWSDLASLEGVSRRVRDRLSLETHRIIARFSFSLDSAVPVRERLERVGLLLAAFAGLTQENLTRGPGWVFLDMGRRIERASLVTEAVEAFVSLRPQESSLGLLLDLFDSGMTYRTRYRLSPQLGPVLDLLLLDETNPRSLAFQLVRLSEHMTQLPRGDRKAYRSEEERAVLDLLTRVRLSDAGDWSSSKDGALQEFFESVHWGLGRLSDALLQGYLAKVEVLSSLQARKKLEP